MIGLEYICKLYKESYNSLAQKLGISRQSINGWIKQTRPIPDKHLPKLAEIFGLSEEYFQKELNDIDKINIQRTKVFNESYEIEYPDTFIDEETGKEVTVMRIHRDMDDFHIQYLDLEKEKILLSNNIVKQIQDKFDEMAESNGWTAYEDATEVLNIYKKLVKVIKHGGIRTQIISNILDGMINYEHDFWGDPIRENDFSKKITEIIKNEEDRLTELMKERMSQNDDFEEILEKEKELTEEEKQREELLKRLFE